MSGGRGAQDTGSGGQRRLAPGGPGSRCQDGSPRNEPRGQQARGHCPPPEAPQPGQGQAESGHTGHRGDEHTSPGVCNVNSELRGWRKGPDPCPAPGGLCREVCSFQELSRPAWHVPLTWPLPFHPWAGTGAPSPTPHPPPTESRAAELPCREEPGGSHQAVKGTFTPASSLANSVHTQAHT